MEALCRIKMSFPGALCARIISVLAIGVATAVCQSQPDLLEPPQTITFSTLTGTNLQPYTGSTEGDFTVTPITGQWFESFYYGNPEPSIFDGPIDDPGTAVIEITDSAGLFTLDGFDFSSNNGDSTYDIEGYLGGTLEYDENGTLPGTFGPYNFSTLESTDSTVLVDGVFIGIIPGSGATSINLDNIVVSQVPEPAGALLLGLGLAAFISVRARIVK